MFFIFNHDGLYVTLALYVIGCVFTITITIANTIFQLACSDSCACASALLRVRPATKTELQSQLSSRPKPSFVLVERFCCPLIGRASFSYSWFSGTCESQRSGRALFSSFAPFALTNWMAFFQLALEQLVYVLIGQKLL